MKTATRTLTPREAPRAPLSRPSRRGTARAFTMVELLVVISIISILLGIGAGIYYKFVRTTALMGEHRAVVGIIQMARSTALAEGGEAFVCIDREQNHIFPFVLQKVGVWHFETLADGFTEGAFQQGGHVIGGNAVLVGGKVGQALLLDGSTHLKCQLFRSAQWVNVPTYDSRDGLAVEAWVAPLSPPIGESATMTLFARAGWFKAALVWNVAAERYALTAEVMMLDAEDGGWMRYTATSEPTLRAGDWTHLRLQGHKLGTGLALTINGVPHVPATSTAQTASAPSEAAETTLGALPDGSERFRGRIDEVIASIYSVDTVHKVTPKLSLEAEGLADGDTIRFDASGRLTPAHDGAVPRVMLREYRGDTVVSSATMTVGPMGAIDVEFEYK
jgi:prepilin-type N-terminal cleavage/methylation domain-containing protein